MAPDTQRLQAPALNLAVRRFGRLNRVGLASLYRRELLRLVKDRIDSLLGPALANLLFMLVLKVAMGRQQVTAIGLPLTDFVAPGLLMFAAGERAFSAGCVSILFDKMEGMIADVFMAPLTATERLAAYASACVSSGLVSAAVTAPFLWPFAHIGIVHPAALACFFVAGTLLQALIGLAAGFWGRRWDHYAAVLGFFLIPLSYLSGMFYPTASLPPTVRSLIAANPLYYVIDGIRYGMTGVTETEPWSGLLLVVILDLLLMAVVYRMFQRGWRVKT
jgi:ABC-2 type transport system permease protein